MNSINNTRLRVAAACALGMAMAGSALAVPKGIVDLTTNYGPSGAIASVVGVSGVNGASDAIQVKFANAMHPGNFGMGVNFAKAWTKSWNDDNTVLTIGGNIDFSEAAEPALIVYLMQTDADRKDIAEPNIFKFRDIKVSKVEPGNGQANVDFNIVSANGKGYSVYVAKAGDTTFKPYGNVNYNAKGAHLKGLDNGSTYQVYIQYQGDGLVATRTAAFEVTPKHPGKK